jgi:hypothetical protein
MEPLSVVKELTERHLFGRKGSPMQLVVGLALLGVASSAIALWVRHFAAKRRKVRQRGTTHRGRIDIPLAPKDQPPVI